LKPGQRIRFRAFKFPSPSGSLATSSTVSSNRGLLTGCPRAMVRWHHESAAAATDSECLESECPRIPSGVPGLSSCCPGGLATDDLLCPCPLPSSSPGPSVRRVPLMYLPSGGRPARPGGLVTRCVSPLSSAAAHLDIVASGGGGPLPSTLPRRVHALSESLSAHSSRRQHLG
jgi:hypothetical protein